MSFDIGIWRTDKKLTNSEAQVIYHRLNDGDVSSVIADDSLLKFYTDLDAVFPLGSDLPDEVLDELPWASSCKPCRTHYVLSVQGEKMSQALTAIESLARKHGLILFDPQDGVIV